MAGFFYLWVSGFSLDGRGLAQPTVDLLPISVAVVVAHLTLAFRHLRLGGAVLRPWAIADRAPLVAVVGAFALLLLIRLAQARLSIQAGDALAATVGEYSAPSALDERHPARHHAREPRGVLRPARAAWRLVVAAGLPRGPSARDRNLSCASR